MNKVLPASNGGDVTDLAFKGEYTSLNRMKAKMSLYRGMYNQAGDNSDLGGGHRTGQQALPQRGQSGVGVHRRLRLDGAAARARRPPRPRAAARER